MFKRNAYEIETLLAQKLVDVEQFLINRDSARHKRVMNVRPSGVIDRINAVRIRTKCADRHLDQKLCGLIGESHSLRRNSVWRDQVT